MFDRVMYTPLNCTVNLLTSLLVQNFVEENIPESLIIFCYVIPATAQYIAMTSILQFYSQNGRSIFQGNCYTIFATSHITMMKWNWKYTTGPRTLHLNQVIFFRISYNQKILLELHVNIYTSIHQKINQKCDHFIE